MLGGKPGIFSVIKKLLIMFLIHAAIPNRKKR
jgi:hypothetical protein